MSPAASRNRSSDLLNRLAQLGSGRLASRRAHVCAILPLQVLMVMAAGLGAFLLRYDFFIPPDQGPCIAWALAAWLVLKPIASHSVGAAGAWQYYSLPDFLRLFIGNIAASAAAAPILIFFCPAPFPTSVIFIDLAVSILLTSGVRIFTRLCFERAARSQNKDRARTLIYGAGNAGVLLLQETRKNSNFPYDICGFIDDGKHKGLFVQGVRVLGAGLDLQRLVSEQRITEVLIAIPSAGAEAMRRITGLCQTAGVNYKTMPAISEILSHRALSNQIREVAVEDVLGRSTVQLDGEKIRLKVEGRVVLVTGAAGSIGSELCRQVARYRPFLLVAFEVSESALFFLEREMQEAYPDVAFCPEIGNIQSLQRVREVFALHLPALVLHAAAFKHVPLMEKHMFQAVENNVFGTHNLATAAREYGIQDFVMISSDKAVNPTNIMGTTKRVAELLIRSLQDGGPRFVSVRFGNVLGSNGSVVPIFKQQIAAGGPVTITHPDMERYFMTIPEAAQLVLQACTMGQGGEIFVLDMGKPVKIVELAKQLIRLSGLRPEKDIQIEFSGVRPGEKLYEELNMSDESMLATHHEKIKIFAGNSMPQYSMEAHLQRLRKACEQRNPRALVRELKTMVPDYTASKEVVERAFTENLLNLGRVLQFNSGSTLDHEPTPALPGLRRQS